MINKFQQGGILAQLQQLPQEQQQQIMQAFAQWAQQKGVDINQLQNNPQALEQALGQFMQEMQQQTQSARHGAKLQYIKSLKHQCAEDEEVVYFKRGGSVDCGCKKKMEEGGPVEKKDNPINRFKNRNLDKKEQGEKPKREEPKEPKIKRPKLSDKKDTNKGTVKIDHMCGGSKMKLQKKGGEVCPKCGKVHSARIGCAVAKFKMRGGIL